MAQITPVGKIFFALIILAIIGGGLYFISHNTDLSSKLLPGKPSPLSSGSNDSAPATTGKVGGKLIVGINTWCGFAGGPYFNDGFIAGPNSRYKKDYKLDVEFKLIDDFQASREALKSGAIDALCFVTVDELPTEITGLNTFHPKIIMQIDWSNGGDAIVGRPGITSAADCVGKSIACAVGTPSHSLLLAWFAAGEIRQDQVKIIEVANGIDAADLFKKRKVDLAVVWAPDDKDCVEKVPGSKVIFSSKTASNVIADAMMVLGPTFDGKKPQLTALVEGWLRGAGEINTSSAAKTRAAQILSDGFNGIGVDFCEEGIGNASLAVYGDNVNFFGLNASYPGVTGEILYNRMATLYSEARDNSGTPLAPNNVPSWRLISDPSIIKSIKLTGPGQEAMAAPVFTKAPRELETKPAIATLHLTVNFSTNSAVLTNEMQYLIDSKFAETARGFRNARIRIEGNTDSNGSTELNHSLSLRRAQSVADYLSSRYGFDPNRFIIIGNGPDHPIASNDTPDGRAQNRRTDFEIVTE